MLAVVAVALGCADGGPRGRSRDAVIEEAVAALVAGDVERLLRLHPPAAVARKACARVLAAPGADEEFASMYDESVRTLREGLARCRALGEWKGARRVGRMEEPPDAVPPEAALDCDVERLGSTLLTFDLDGRRVAVRLGDLGRIDGRIYLGAMECAEGS